MWNIKRQIAIGYRLIIAATMGLLLVACGGGGGGSSAPTFTLSATVSGLTSGTLVLQNNGGDDLAVTANGVATFATPIAQNGSYAVTVKSTPTGQVCTVNNGSGSGVVSNVNNVTVTCSSTRYTISGSVTGLSSGQVLVLANTTNEDTATLTGSSANPQGFTFPLPVAYLGSYNVVVKTQPANQTCSVSGGSGSGSGVTSNITSVAIVCSNDTYSIGGTVSGLVTGQQVTLYNNGGDATTIAYPNTSFNFPTPVAYGGSISVTVNQQPTSGTCSVSNGTGTVSGAVSNVSVSCSPTAYTVGGTVSGLTSSSVTLRNNGSDPKIVTFPATSFTFDTPVAFGSAYDVAVSSSPLGQSCTINSGTGSGTVSGNVTNVGVTCVSSTYAYVVNYGNSTVSTYTVGSDGVFVPRGTPLATRPGPTGMAVNAAYTRAYMTNYNDNSVSAFSIAGDGALTLIGTYAAGTNPNSVAVSPAGNYAYVANYGSDNISQYSIEPDGSLIPLTEATIPAGDGPAPIIVNSTGTNAYVTNNNSSTISTYSIGANGLLTSMGSTTLPTGSNPNAIAINASKTFAYVTNNKVSGTVSMFSVDINGALTALSQPTVSAGSGPSAIAISPDGEDVFVTNYGDNTVSMYSAGSNGLLLARTPATVTTQNNPRGVAIDSSGTHLYVANAGSATVSMYSVSSGGIAAPLTPPTVSAGTNPYGITIITK